jgi:vacuolar protein sorting-associated protein 52
MTTNLSVLQTSVFLKYRSLFAFLQRQAPNVASEVQRAYVGTVRTYFETGFRRYIRSLTWIKVPIPFTESKILIRSFSRRQEQQNAQIP